MLLAASPTKEEWDVHLKECQRLLMEGLVAHGQLLDELNHDVDDAVMTLEEASQHLVHARACYLSLDNKHRKKLEARQHARHVRLQSYEAVEGLDEFRNPTPMHLALPFLNVFHGLYGGSVPLHQGPRTHAAPRRGQSRQRSGGRGRGSATWRWEVMDDEAIYIARATLPPSTLARLRPEPSCSSPLLSTSPLSTS
ncbi:hypothetical protein HETIRDRAFT_435280 [Heterobasidion irregulare TC 32-1]|uniref:Uncharacterized protein n=1 Tax=Heterobasidion irregulare (strain TC 32-1) TaxID=747525 RepID=W4K062_HETIT|nr:uncharacterized protein HETIRDRAFT_435280 [Heterobasidion irregulare TC 32-1]ETW78491.1 hypothetical protein HETIRDRAFT_435280 [Heterobasidion irregulare TC 32-1]